MLISTCWSGLTWRGGGKPWWSLFSDPLPNLSSESLTAGACSSQTPKKDEIFCLSLCLKKCEDSIMHHFLTFTSCHCFSHYEWHLYSLVVCRGFPGDSDSKEATCNEGDLGLIPGLGRSPGGGHGSPLQYSFLENPRGQRSLADCSPWGHRVRHDWATAHRTARRQQFTVMLCVLDLNWFSQLPCEGGFGILHIVSFT